MRWIRILGAVVFCCGTWNSGDGSLFTCLEDFPYAFDGGTKCCAYGREDHKEGDPNCNRREISEKSTCCVENKVDRNNCTKHYDKSVKKCNDHPVVRTSHPECPKTHPYAFHKGERCCAYGHEDDKERRLIKITSTMCKGMPKNCVHEKTCRSAAICPLSHPYAYDNGKACCGNNKGNLTRASNSAACTMQDGMKPFYCLTKESCKDAEIFDEQGNDRTVKRVPDPDRYSHYDKIGYSEGTSMGGAGKPSKKSEVTCSEPAYDHVNVTTGTNTDKLQKMAPGPNDQAKGGAVMHRPGSMIKITCKKGYRAAIPIGGVICQQDGKWSNPRDPKCYAEDTNTSGKPDTIKIVLGSVGGAFVLGIIIVCVWISVKKYKTGNKSDKTEKKSDKTEKKPDKKKKRDGNSKRGNDDDDQRSSDEGNDETNTISRFNTTMSR